MKWFANVKDDAVVQGLLDSLPLAVLTDIVSKYRDGVHDQKLAVAATHRRLIWPGGSLTK